MRCGNDITSANQKHRKTSHKEVYNHRAGCTATATELVNAVLLMCLSCVELMLNGSFFLLRKLIVASKIFVR